MAYDPLMEALIAAMIQALDHDADMTRGYVDQLRQLDVTLAHILADPESHKPDAATEAIMREALGKLDAKAGDQYLGYGEVLRRCQEAVERELFRWDSSMLQPAGLSGAIQIPIGGGQWEAHNPVAKEQAILKR